MSNYRPKIPQKPLVVCVGFLGSKPRHIQKYADLFSSIEVNVAPLTSETPILTKPDVVQYIPPLETFLSSAKIKSSAEALGTMIEKQIATPHPIDPPKGKWLFPWQTEPFYSPAHIVNDLNNYQPRKIVFLCLSNNGAFGYANMLNLLKKEKRQLYHKINSQTSGVIWDSSPSHPTPDVFQRGFVSAVGTLIGRKPQPHDLILTPLFSGVISYLLKSKAYTEAASEVTESLEYSVPYHAPQLYLITEKDDLVLPDATREYVANRAKRVSAFFRKYPTLSHISEIAMGNGSGLAIRSGLSSGNAGSDVITVTPISETNLTLTSHGKPLQSQDLTDIHTWQNIALDSTLPAGGSDAAKQSRAWIDQHQAEFGLSYNYNQHVFPHYNIEDLPPTESYKTWLQKGEGEINPNPDQNKWLYHNDHDQLNASALHSHVTTSMDLTKLPPLVDHDALLRLATHRQHDRYVNEHRGADSASSPDQFEPAFLDHAKYCPHSHHIDVLFDPKQKVELDSFRFDPKIKPLFEKTERFGNENHQGPASASNQPDVHHFLFDFKDSSHVQHIRKHPEQYRELVDAFCNYAFRG